jgi:hypothetical protein
VCVLKINNKVDLETVFGVFQKLTSSEIVTYDKLKQMLFITYNLINEKKMQKIVALLPCSLQKL